MARTIQEILDWWQAEQYAILKRRFEIVGEAQNLSRQEIEDLTSDVVGRLTDEGAYSLLLKGAQDRALKLREEARLDYEGAYMAYIDELQQRKAELELLLFKEAREADPALLLEVAGASSEKLRSVMALGFESGNLVAGDVAFCEAWRCADDMLLAYYSETRGAADETWAGLYLELVEAEAITPLSDPADRFDQLFGEGPGPEELGRELSARDVLKGRQSPSPSL